MKHKKNPENKLLLTPYQTITLSVLGILTQLYKHPLLFEGDQNQCPEGPEIMPEKKGGIK